VGGRPNAIAVGRGMVFATNFSYNRLTLIDEAKVKLERPRRRPWIGTGASDVTSGPGGIWVVNNRRQAVYQLDPATGRERGRVTFPTKPRYIAVGHSAVWVGMLGSIQGTPDALTRVDPRTREITGSFPVPLGIHRLVATPAGIWVVHRRDPSVALFDPRSEQFTRQVRIGSTPLGEVSYADGAVWVTSPLEDTVSRIDDKTGKKVSSGVGRRPIGIAALGKQVWVTSLIDHTVTRVNPRSGRPAGEPIPVPLNPYAVALTRDSVWLTAIGHGDVVRVRYAPPR
jgi:DNA-binding beta-propeller fold protein YncE